MELVIDLSIKFLTALMPTIVLVYTWYFLLEEKFNLKKIKNYIIIITMSIISSLNYYLVNVYAKIVLINIICILMVYIIFKKKLHYTIMTSIYGYLILMASEIPFSIVMIGMFKLDATSVVNNFFGSIVSNLIISLIAMIIIKIPITKKLYNKLINLMERILDIYVVEIIFIIMVFLNIYLVIPYYGIKLEYSLIINIAFLVFCLFLFFSYCRNKNKFLQTNDKYNTILNSLREYEELVSLYRINNHENKNQLMTIRGMVQKENKQAVAYIDEIVNNQLKDNQKILNKVNKIPEGGLRGLVYAKLLIMKEQKIKYGINISKDIKTSDLINIGDATILDICKIIGVFLDNAIEYLTEIKKRDVNISLYKEDEKMIIEISNNLEETINLEKINKKGYTTKEKGHGYGLNLVDKLVKGNKKLKHKNRVNEEYFTQILEIKM